MVLDVSSFVQSGKRLQFNTDIPHNAEICILDSSFNPPNFAHRKLAQLCRTEYPNSYVVFMLATGNADKAKAPIDQLQARVNMIEILMETEFQGDSKIAFALTTEVRFIDKAAEVKAALPQSSRIIFAMGFDTLVRIADQRYYTEPVKGIMEKFFGIVELLVLTRNEDSTSSTPVLGVASQQQQLAHSDPVLKHFISRINFQEASGDTEQISSSRARKSISNLEECSPKAVAQYVLAHHLYNL